MNNTAQLSVFVIFFFLFHCGLFRSVSLADDSIDYSFDTAGLAAKSIDLSADIEFYPSFSVYNRTAPFYSLKFGNKNPSFADNYNLKAEASLRFQRKPLLAFISGSLFGSYLRREDSLHRSARLYETYLKYAPNAPLSFLLGKRLFQWGKGYSLNPVSFAGRMKDLNDIDAALEGYWNISFEYVKSFDSPLSAIALNTALLPVYDFINKDYLADESVAGLAKLYMLLFNTDIDLCFLSDGGSIVKTGLDFSRNVLSNWEIHGEWAFIKNSNATVFSNESTLVAESHPANNMVAGTRYLAPFNTTFILEYLHIGSGYSTDEIEGYRNALDYAAISSDPRKKQAILDVHSKYSSSQFMATDYIYFKASHPDPFNLVYFTPAFYAIMNVFDHSAMMGLELTYSRSARLLFTGRLIAFTGKRNSEYGSKLAHDRIELRVKWAF